MDVLLLHHILCEKAEKEKQNKNNLFFLMWSCTTKIMQQPNWDSKKKEKNWHELK